MLFCNWNKWWLHCVLFTDGDPTFQFANLLEGWTDAMGRAKPVQFKLGFVNFQQFPLENIVYHYSRQLDCWFEGFQVSSWWKLTSQWLFSRNLFFKTFAAMMKVGHIFWHLWFMLMEKNHQHHLWCPKCWFGPTIQKRLGSPSQVETTGTWNECHIMSPVYFPTARTRRFSDGVMDVWEGEAKFILIIVTIGEVLF